MEEEGAFTLSDGIRAALYRTCIGWVSCLGSTRASSLSPSNSVEDLLENVGSDVLSSYHNFADLDDFEALSLHSDIHRPPGERRKRIAGVVLDGSSGLSRWQLLKSWLSWKGDNVGSNIHADDYDDDLLPTLDTTVDDEPDRYINQVRREVENETHASTTRSNSSSSDCGSSGKKKTHRKGRRKIQSSEEGKPQELFKPMVPSEVYVSSAAIGHNGVRNSEDLMDDTGERELLDNMQKINEEETEEDNGDIPDLGEDFMTSRKRRSGTSRGGSCASSGDSGGVRGAKGHRRRENEDRGSNGSRQRRQKRVKNRGSISSSQDGGGAFSFSEEIMNDGIGGFSSKKKKHRSQRAHHQEDLDSHSNAPTATTMTTATSATSHTEISSPIDAINLQQHRALTKGGVDSHDAMFIQYYQYPEENQLA